MADQDQHHAAPVATALWAIGVTCIVGGGLVAAVTGPLALTRGSWVAAYLVLVAGVAQAAMGWARRRLPALPTDGTRGWYQLGCWNAGNVLVITGTLVRTPLLVDLGSVLLVLGLVLALLASRAPHGESRSVRFPAVWVYRAVLLVLAISIPVGILLSHLRHG